MVGVYSGLKGFPQPEDFPQYYDLLLHIGRLTEKPKTSLLIASDNNKAVLGAVVYLGDMSNYGSKGLATQEKKCRRNPIFGSFSQCQRIGNRKSSDICLYPKGKGFRLGPSDPAHYLDDDDCLEDVRKKMGFQRAYELDFDQGDLHVFGFRLLL